MSDFVDRAARVAIRNALLKASKQHAIVQGDCGRMPWCGTRWSDSQRAWVRMQPKGCCALCAYLLGDAELTKEAKKPGAYPEELVSEAIGVDVNWLMSFLQGFDGDELANEDRAAYRIGQALWRLFSGDSSEEEAS